MSVKNELESLSNDNRLARVASYTYSHNSSDVAKSINLVLTRDFDRPFQEFVADETVSLRILGNRETFKVTDTETDRTSQTVYMLSKEIEQVYLSASKELRFMSMDALEEKEFNEYLSQDGSNPNSLPYRAYIKRFHYEYRPGETTLIHGGWYAWGDPDENSIMDVLASILDIRVVCTLPPFRIRQYSVPMGSSIFQALIELTSMFKANVFMKNGTLFITEAGKHHPWSGVLKLRNCSDLSERILYKENTSPEDIIMEAGQGPINIDRYEGPIFPENQITSTPITIGGEDFGVLDLINYGPEAPPPENTIETVNDPSYGVIQASQTVTNSVWDLFHARPIRYRTYRSDWRYHNFDEVLFKEKEEEELLRYRYLEGCFENPRLDSGEELTLYGLNTATPGIETDLRTHQNWCRLVRRGAMQWIFSQEKNDYEHVLNPNSEVELEWRFYDKFGRMSMRSRRIYTDVHTSHFVPEDYVEYTMLDTRSVPWKKYNSITYNQGAQLSGTLIKILPSEENNYFPFDPRTVVLDEMSIYAPVGKKRYKVTTKRVFLDESLDRRQADVSTREIPSSEVETIPIRPKEYQIVMKDEYRKQARLLDKPFIRMPASEVWVESEAEEIYKYMRTHLVSPEIQRSLTLPFSFYIPKGSVVQMSEVRDYRRNEILPDRNMLGAITEYTVSKNGNGTVSTTINLRGLQ